MKGSSHMTAKRNIAVVLTVIIALMFSTQAFSKNKAAEAERLKMSVNKVSVMNEYLFFPKTNTQKKMSVQTFDEAGNKLSMVELDNEEKEIKKIEYTYDSKNKETSFTEYDGAGNMRQKCVSRYDEKSEALAGELFYNASGEPAYKRISKPDKFGNIGEQALYYKNNKFLGRSSYKHDGAGNKTEATTYDAANNFSGRYVYAYDKNANLTETLSYDKNNKFSGKKIFNYDQKNLLTESIGYNASGTANSWRKYEYEYHKTQTAAAVKPPVEPVKKAPEPAKEPAVEVRPEVNTAQVPPQPQPDTNADNGHKEPAEQARNSAEDKKNEYLKRDPYNPPPDAVVDSAVLIGNCGFYPEKTVIKLLEHNNIDVNTVNELGQSLLMIAASSGKAGLVEELIKKGAKPDLKDLHGNCVIEYAMSGKNSRIISIIKNATEKQ